MAGHSGSCLVARRVTLDRPELVAGLVLEASPTTLRGDRGLDRFFCTELLVEGSSTIWPELSIDDYADRTAATMAAWRRMNG